MNKEKKVILFIVEGGSDKIFFSEFEKVFPNYHVLVHVVKGDIFSNRDLKNKSITSVVKEIIQVVLNENSILGLVPSDIETIYQITDTDCCFQVEEFSNMSLTVIRRTKAEKINDVLAIQEYMSTPENDKYKLLFFAPNIEGPLTPEFDPTGKHGGFKQVNMLNLISNLRLQSKGMYWAMKELLDSDEIAPFSEYFDSWDFIRADNNSQGNFTNLKFILDSVEEKNQKINNNIKTHFSN